MTKINPNVDKNPTIEKLMKGFVPQMGSRIDIDIVKIYTKLLSDYTLVIDAQKKAKERGGKSNINKSKEIMDLELRLESLMAKRNK